MLHDVRNILKDTGRTLQFYIQKKLHFSYDFYCTHFLFFQLCCEFASWVAERYQGNGISGRIVIIYTEYLLDKNYITLKQNRIAACE